MHKTMIFTVQAPENGKPIFYAQLVNNKYKLDQEYAKNLIRGWFDNNDLASASDEEIEDLAYKMRKEGYAWWNKEICFELSEVYG